jgi:hypothetical protein
MTLPLERRQPTTDAADPIPIWMAALIASRCQATSQGPDRMVNWRCVSGRALYTNGDSEVETIEPFGVPLRRGETVAVSWLPGDTAYTVELYRHEALAA